ncbi:NifB/NifX family molybdenum-iron cluster-binding protein [Fusibacter sp. JL216-2]|uniref:NifB/NifX family molybdenum-iron cluster-binding protein n=1 Tax=Fusibacter sp. JL216-2 TaxID=3071453 RepID=UPI003D33B63D
MKIALPSRNKQIDSHFGHCEYFTVYTIDENKKIVDEQTVTSPAGCGCKSNIAKTLADQGVKLMLAGNMGGGAVRVLNVSGIDVIRGCSGDTRQVAEAWLEGNITDSGEACASHDHECSH